MVLYPDRWWPSPGRGWGGKGDDLWDKARKRDVLGMCRNEFPDHALPWLDAAVALGQDDDPAYSRLLGTGGNFGRQDLSATYLARLQSVLTDRRSRGWLHALLSGEESTPYLRDAVGQFDPGRAGGIQSSPLEKADDKGFVNPWAFLLTVEGALLFATAVVRRHGAEYARVALPFQVRGSAAGYPTQAPGESVLGELWAPEWSALARLDEVAHLLAEGRAEWDDRPARSGLDSSGRSHTGVDRDIVAFERHLFVDRLGQNPLAVPAGRIEVRRRRGVELLAGLDGWLGQLRRTELPSQVAAQLRMVEQALFAHARSGDPGRLAEVIAAVGDCHEAVARSGKVRQAVRPLVMPGGPALLKELRELAAEDAQLQIALALATARDEDSTSRLSLRMLLSPVSAERFPRWTGRPPLAPLISGLAASLGEAARRRGFPRTFDDRRSVDLEPAVKGVRIGYLRGITRAPAVGSFQPVSWTISASLYRSPGCSPSTGAAHPMRTSAAVSSDRTPHWTCCCHSPAPARSDSPRSTAAARVDWLVLLGAGQAAQVLTDASRRLRIAGLPRVIAPATALHSGARLAAVLLLRVPDSDRLAALRRVAVFPEPTTEQNQEIPA